MRWVVLVLVLLCSSCEKAYERMNGMFAFRDVAELTGLPVDRCEEVGRTRVVVCNVLWTEQEALGVRERLHLRAMPEGMGEDCGGEVKEWWGTKGRPQVLRELKTGGSGERFGVGKKKAGGYCVVLEYSYG